MISTGEFRKLDTQLGAARSMKPTGSHQLQYPLFTSIRTTTPKAQRAEAQTHTSPFR